MKKRSKKRIKICLIMVFVMSLVLGTCVRNNQASAYSTKEWEILKYTNIYRMKKGLQPLMLSSKVQKLSDIRKKEVAKFYSHTRPNGKDCFTVINSSTISPFTMGENIATGYRSAKEVVDAWIKSKGHRENILNRTFTHMGAGYLGKGEYGTSWVQFFTGTAKVNKMTLKNAGKIKSYKKGASIEKMNRTIVFSTNYGTSYMPLISKMCKGYKKNKVGKQTIRVTYKTPDGKKLTLSFKIKILKK